MTKKKTPQTKNVQRAPVVVVVGHIDHGKSTLLDYIRQTAVTETETGGITQRVSAYEVTHRRDNGTEESITFLDTPGHEAFSSIRERSAQIADLAILVVSAEDGVKNQTLEALNAIQSAKLPYLVAINKIDRENANIERTKQSLAENNVMVEGYGGEIPCVPISAKTGQGIPELLELILIMSELAELTSNPLAPAEGFVLESERHPKMGIITTLIIKNGTLRQSDFVIAGSIIGKIKKMKGFAGENVSELHASSPAVILGLSEVPLAGVAFISTNDKRKAETLIKEKRDEENKERISNLQLPEESTGEKIVTLPVVIKADNLGSLEAVAKELTKLGSEIIKILIIHRGIGQIVENDVKLAAGDSPAIIIGFNVKTERAANELAEKNSIEIKTFDIIYHLSEWLKEEIEKKKTPETTEEIIGEAKILKIFSKNKNRQIVGGVVTSGYVKDRELTRIIRRETVLGEGEVVELKKQKIAVKRIEEGEQFGALIESRTTIAPGDKLIVFRK